MNEPVLKPEDLRVLRCLSSEEKKKSQLVNESGLPDTQVRYSLQRLIKTEYGKKKGKGYYVKTPQGYEFEKKREVPMELTIDNEELIKVVDKFPTPGHKTIFWFWLASIVAKKYLLKTERFRYYNPGFVAIGETAEGKSLLADTLFRALRLDPTEHLIDVTNSTATEILGRRYLISPGEYRLNPAPYFSRIALCFDEAGQARDRKTFDAIMFYLNGRREFENEKTRITQLQTALVCMNPRDKWEIPDPFKRRSFILDTRSFDLDPRNLADIGEEVSHGKVPKVNIEGLEPDILFLKPEDTKLLKKLLYDGLKGKPEYRLVNPDTLSKVVLGWLILTKTHDVAEVIYWAVEGNLTLCQTQGATVDNWRRTLREKKGTYLAGKNPEFEKLWIKEIETLETEDRVIIDRGIEKQSREDEDIDKKLDFEIEIEDVFKYWGKLLIRLDEMYPKYKKENKAAIKAMNKERTDYMERKRTPELLATIERIFTRRKERIEAMLSDDIAEAKRLKAEKEAKDAGDEAEKERKKAIVEDRSDTAADLRSKLWNLDTSTGHRESKPLRESLKTIKDNPDTNYARTNFSRRKAAALAMIERFTEERRLKGAPAAEQLENGFTSVVCKIASIFMGKKTEESTSERGGLPPETVDFKGKDTQELLERFGHGASESEQPKVRRGKTLFEKWREAHRKKKGEGEEPKSRGFMGRSEEDL